MNIKPNCSRFLPTALLCALAAANLTAAEVEVTLRLADDAASEAVQITMVAEPVDADGSAAIEHSLSPGSWAIDLPTPGPWRLRASAPGYWGDTAEVDPANAGESTELRLWRAGTLRGSLSTTGSEILPSVLRLDLSADESTWGGGEMPPPSSLDCPVAGGLWRCEVPAGSLNLVLSAGLFIRHDRWEVRVEPDQVVDLGVFDLELGGALSGRVTLEDRGAPGPECEVRIIRSGAGQRAGAGMPDVPLEDDGSFELGALAAREYAVIASQEGYITARSAPIRISPGETVEIPETLVLRRPATLELIFAPRVGPDGRGWRFTVSRVAEPGQRGVGHVANGQSGSDGRWVSKNLGPGRYQVALQESIKTRRQPQQVQLEGGQTTTLFVELPFVFVEGQVLMDDEPLAAQVILSQPQQKLRATFKSNADGTFRGLLDREGRWQVKVEAASEGISRDVDPIDVVASGETREAWIEIQLPGTVLEGEVSDLWGDPKAGATVRVVRRGVEKGAKSVKTDADGRFRIRGLAPGSISVMAQAGSMKSGWFQLVLYEGHPVPPLDLVVREPPPRVRRRR